MIIKKFQADTETEAIMLAKEELGKEAIVMNIKTVKPRGIYKIFKKPMVEITAAVEDNVAYSNEDRIVSEVKKLREQEHTEQGGGASFTAQNAADNAAKQKGAASYTASGAEDDVAKNAAAVIAAAKQTVAKQTASTAGTLFEASLPKEPLQKPKEVSEHTIEQKLNDLQQLLEKQMQVQEPGKNGSDQKTPKSGEEPEETKARKESEKSSKNAACIRLIYEQLIDNEVDEKYANQIISEIEKTLKKDASVDNVLSSIYQKIILKLGQPDIIELGENQPKYIFFIGPTGVGKTTTIAKIASSLTLAQKARVALVTADTYRIAAVEQLKTYANILGIPLHIMFNEADMEKLEKELEDFDVVLIDTAGRSHRNQKQREDIANLVRCVPEENREVYLVLSATTKYADLVKITDTYQEISDYSLIFTKLDETNAIGNLLNIRMYTGAPLSYSTWGQNVPDDIGKINAQSIAKKLLGGND